MALRLNIVSEHHELMGDDAERVFREDGGTIGRSLQNDWILPDRDRYVSGRHATIDHKGGIYYLLDTSSNGVYINDEVEPIGKGNPRRLFNGDRIRMGDFQFAVSLDSGEGLEMPPDPQPTVVPDHIEQLVDEVSLRTGVKLLDEEEITGDDEFRSVLFGNPVDKAPPTVEPRPKPEPKPEPERAAVPEKPAQRKDKGFDARAEDLFGSFLEGLGVDPLELHPSVNRPELMLTAGHILREFVEGTINLLASRANLKNTFQLDQTAIMPRHNNPLKLSANPGDLVKQLLVGDEGDYLGAKNAVREVCTDLLNHQNAFLEAMNSAFIDFAERFEPEELQNGFDRAMSGSKLLAFMNKSKYWDLYCDLYPIVTEKGDGRFPQMFGEEFVKAYERQVAEYQRHDRERQVDRLAKTGTGKLDVTATQKIPPPVFEEDTAADADEPVDARSDTAAEEIDQSFIDDLENSMNEALSVDLKEA